MSFVESQDNAGEPPAHRHSFNIAKLVYFFVTRKFTSFLWSQNLCVTLYEPKYE